VSWVRLDDGYADRPDLVAAGPVAFAVATWAICWSARHLTDGEIPRSSLIGCTFVANRSQLSRVTRRLEVAGFWTRTDDGYQIVEPRQYLQDPDVVREKRAANARRQAEWRKRQRGLSHVTSRVTGATRNAPPDPDPEGVRGETPPVGVVSPLLCDYCDIDTARYAHSADCVRAEA
jgi:hypothetical protein